MQHVRSFHCGRLGVAAIAALVVVALAGARVVAGSATVAGPPPSIVYDYGVGNCDPVYPGSPCFGPPQVVQPGDTTNLTVTVEQDDPQPLGTIAITWPANALAFVSNGDGSATCTATNHSVTCSYTDFSHGYKSDNFTFTVGPQTSPTVTAQITATTIDGTSQVATATLSFPSKTYLTQQATPTVATVGGWSATSPRSRARGTRPARSRSGSTGRTPATAATSRRPRRSPCR